MNIRTEKDAREKLRQPPVFNDVDQVAAIEFIELVDQATLAMASCRRIHFHVWKSKARDFWCDTCIRDFEADVIGAALKRLGRKGEL